MCNSMHIVHEQYPLSVTCSLLNRSLFVQNFSLSKPVSPIVVCINFFNIQPIQNISGSFQLWELILILVVVKGNVWE